MTGQQMGMATGPAKLQAVKALVDKLTQDLDQVTMFPSARNQALEELKIYGRDLADADPLYAKEGIEMILRHAFHSPARETARAALKVLANAMLLKPETRQMFVDLGFAPKACNNLKTESWDDEFLLSRILFLATYDTVIDISDLVKNHRLAERVVENLERHVTALSGKAKGKAQPMEDMAMVETTKLLFNVTHHCKEEAPRFSPAVPLLVPLLWKHEIPLSKPLESPFGPLTNGFLNLDLAIEKSQAALFPKSDPTKFTARLIELLDRAMKSYADNEMESAVTPLISLIRKVYGDAPEPVQKLIRTKLLPTPEDRKSVLGKGQTLSAQLLKNSTNPITPALRDAISHLLFDMSDKNASRFVENVGYGFASGFLFQNNLPIPASAAEAFSTGDSTGMERPVNPITGQFLDREKAADMPPMTEEEKEREAERLFVLFERLKRTGVMDVQNPVEAAMREGKFRELGDDDVEELD